MFENKPIFGMVHMSPGPRGRAHRAATEVHTLESVGVEYAIVENYHGSSSDVLEALIDISASKIGLGVNILPNDFERAFKLADNFHCQFIQMDYISGVYQRNNKQLDVNKYKQFRKRYPKIKVLGGVWPKYYYPVSGSVLEDDIKAAMDRCDAIVVTGAGTGMETPLDKIKKFRDICGDFPLIVGAGVDKSNITQQLKIADGAIIGSAFKLRSDTMAQIDRSLTEDIVNKRNDILTGRV